MAATQSPQPIAIIGLGCRFPGGADDWQSYWQLLESGRDAITQTPPDRWSLQKFYAPGGALPGKTQSQWGGYVDGIDQFDPQLFGISPREAASMDPQQRMLLEVTWRALEDAGQPVERVAGQDVAVFAGISSFDYAVASLSFQDRGVIGPYSNTGGSSSIAANRVSYCFDLRGPSVAVDTACSSSLVAVHMACQSILRGDCPMALAGGVNALLLPDFYVAFSQLGVLSPDGRCKTFDARADGYVRAEGAGMVLLKPLADAVRDNDPVYAVIRATALNQDGHTQGMTVPSQQAQETLLRAACRRANINPADIQYVEAHGTGTPVGDPIEANALAAVLGENRKADQPCCLGSVKTNIGHLEAGAGIASLIKVALALHHKRIPAHLNFQSANPHIDFEKLKLRLPLNTEDWRSGAGPRLAGVNGFGYGGANAHVIVEEAPTTGGPQQQPLSGKPELTAQSLKQAVYEVSSKSGGNGHKNGRATSAPILLPLSARSKRALAEVASRMADWLDAEASPAALAEIASFVAFRRTHQELRATVSGTRREQWSEQLRAIAAAPETATESRLSPDQIDRGLLFVCSGQGPQWWAMGRQLYRVSEIFRDSIGKCDREFAKYVSWSLVEELHRDEHDSRMQKTSIAQPSIFALQISLAAVWESLGVRPAAIVGHSVGEIAAAHLSGALTWQDACCVAVHRGRTMDLASSRGAMIAAGLSAAETEQWIRGLEDKVSLAAINGPTSVTISGADDAIEELAQRIDAKGIFCRRLQVEYAFHSPQMEPVRDELLRSLANIQPRRSHTPLISTVTGDRATGEEFGAEYWWQNVRQSVRFADAMRIAAGDGFGAALEIGPHPVLTFAITECFQQQGAAVRVFPSLHREREDNLCLSDSLGSLYKVGFDLQWSKIFDPPTERIELPYYPFQHQRCWLESQESALTRKVEQFHPLLGDSTLAATPTWNSRVDLKLQEYLADHCVRDACMLPAAAMIEIAGAAARQIKANQTVTLRHLRLHGPCLLVPERPLWFETSYRADRRTIELASRDVDETKWRPLATVELSDDIESEILDPDALAAARARCTESFTGEACYDYCEQLGLQYEKRFRGIQGGVRRNAEAVAEVQLDADIADQAGEYGIHPALLDSCFHGMIAADAVYDHKLGGLYLPVQIRELRLIKPAGSKVTAHVRLISKTEYRLVADIDIFDQSGQPCVLLRGFESQRVGLRDTAETVHDLVYRYAWKRSELPSEEAASGESRCWCVFTDQVGFGDQLCQSLRRSGDRVIQVQHGQAFRKIDDHSFVIDPEQRDEFARVLRHVTESGPPITDLAYLWGIDAPETAELTSQSLDKSTVLTTLAPLHLVQAWESVDPAANARLSIVTAGAQSGDDAAEPVAISQTPLVGFGRVIVSESSRLQSKLIDLPPIDAKRLIGKAAIGNLLAEITSSADEEDEVMYRHGERFVHRFVQQVDQPVAAAAAECLPCQLEIGRSSGVEELQYRTRATTTLAPHEIEIEVLATGLNFSDVMKALDLYPGLPDGPVPLGAECSGRISRVGAAVDDWQVGDEVIAVAPGSFGTHVSVNAALVAGKPSNISHAEAATIPIAFLTAHYALGECARMRADDRVLIHSASGGVGLAAMQLAKIAGATVLATAGNEEKRDFVRQLGAVEVMDSRSLTFAEQTLQATAGEGVDIILNSLPGEAITQGLSILKTGGRFLEIGKRDIYADAPLGLHPFRNNLAFFAIDLDQLFKQQPERMGQLLRELVPRFESGELQPLPTKTYQADQTRSAFRFMQQGKHIGKIAVDYHNRPRDVLPGSYDPIEFRSDATYWLAGGLGGFGLQIARWMVDQGARHLVLSGRSETPSVEAQHTIDQMTSTGATITVIPADITQAADVRKVLAAIDTDLPELRGVFHTAMVLEDRLLVDLDRETLERVLRPKVIGGWNLHRETVDRKLDHFVLFSSLSSVFGHAGQANYSAANALLDGLAHYRRAMGLTATVLNWGHLGEVGYLAQRQQLGERLERQGVLSFTVRQATDALEYALQTRAVQLSVLRMDWSVWRGLGITSRVSPRFAHLIRNRATGGSSRIELAGADELRSADPAQRSELVSAVLRSKAGLLLGIDGEEIERDRPLLELGLDSLMAVEMRNWIESQIEINLPISVLMRSAGLDQLTATVCELISGADGSSAQLPAVESEQDTITADEADSLLTELPELGDDQVAQLLSQMLRQQDNG
jgi:acyl transferase domain-containing protein/NADP-dependent 3-hydroxy acid dehydrogenase YdfG/acyl carrier protein